MKRDLIFYNAVRWGPPHTKPRIAPGLCNRLRGMFSVYAFADFLGVPFGFAWHPSNPCPCWFREIFEVPSGVIYQNDREWLSSESEQINIEVFRTFDPPWHFWNNVIRNNYDLEWEDFLETYRKHLKKLKPIDTLNDKIEKFSNEVGLGDRIGVHVRKTDMVLAGHSGITQDEWYFKMLDAEVEKNSDTRFFLATDNNESRNLFLERYGDKMISFTSDETFKEDKMRQTSMDAAVVDLWSLSKCRLIYGEQGSSFGDIASDMGNEKLVKSEW